MLSDRSNTTSIGAAIIVRHEKVVTPSVCSLARNIDGVTAYTLNVDGQDRRYQLERPASLPVHQPAPVVVVLHGGFGTGQGGIRHGRWLEAAERHGFVVLAPDGFRRTWNAGDCCGPAARLNIADVAFLDAMVDDAAQRTALDLTLVYATGMSNGGMMAYRWACESRTRLRAIAPVAGTLTFNGAPRTPVSLLHIHGTEDRNVLFLGGIGPRARDRGGQERPPVQYGLDVFIRANGCSPESSTRVDGAVTTTQWTGGRDDTTVRLIVVAGGGHAWPGGEQMHARLDEPSRALDATETICQFFGL
jgi:polyhydroxybutyrate depolymerase